MQTAWLTLGLLAALLAPGAARAQQGLRIDRLMPPPTAGDGLAIPTAQTVGHLEPAFGLVLDYALDPLVARSSYGDSGSVVSHRVVAHVLAAIGVLDLLEFHLRLPVVFQAGDAPILAGESFEAPDAVTVADPALGGSVRIFGDEPQGFHLGAMVEAFIPLTGSNGYASDEEFSLRGLVLADVVLGTITIELLAGASYRPERQLRTYRSASEFHFAGGARFQVIAGLDLFGELTFTTGLRDDLAFQSQGSALELLLGGRYRTEIGLAIEAGIGIGYLRAPGAPAFRAFASIRWDPPAAPLANADGDELPDETDACPNEAEDIDRFRDDDGCPEHDNDDDGVPDAVDECGREEEDRDGWLDEDGCPDPDDDDDGVPDGEDACPRAPGNRGADGCPVTLRIEGDAIFVIRNVDFAVGEPSLLPTNGMFLDELSGLMVADTAARRWRISVRPTSTSRRDDGRALAQARADAIVRSLSARGVPAERLEAGVLEARDDEFVRVELLDAPAGAE